LQQHFYAGKTKLKKKESNAVENRSVVYRKSHDAVKSTNEKVALDRGGWVSLFTATAASRGFRFPLLFGCERNEVSVLSILNNAGRQWVGRWIVGDHAYSLLRSAE
jgi:hypothetical protein